MQVIERSKPKKKSMFASPKVDNQSPLGQFPIVAVDSILEDESEHYPLFKAFSSLKDYPKVKLIKVVPHIRKIPNYAEMVAYPELYIKKDETINSTFGGIASNLLLIYSFFLYFVCSKEIRVFIWASKTYELLNCSLLWLFK